ncbi:MAG: hypothetical protein NTY03_04345 [Candidatus Bathyarchaeota archaeon]|nr:hypothetical protein [Candidatus Bathyarchaeota archaeon]
MIQSSTQIFKYIGGIGKGMRYWLLLVCLLLCVGFASATTYTVSTCSGLQNISADYGGTYNLANDIDCSNFTWTNLASAFTGIVDGKNFTIKNLYYNNSATTPLAFLPNPGTCTVKNLCFDNLTMVGLDIV